MDGDGVGHCESAPRQTQDSSEQNRDTNGLRYVTLQELTSCDRFVYIRGVTDTDSNECNHFVYSENLYMYSSLLVICRHLYL